MSRRAILGTAAVAGLTGHANPRSAAHPPRPTRPHGGYAHNVEVIGYSDLDGRPGFKMAIRRKQDRWYLYLGHVWHSGWTILDVTNPRQPQVVAFVRGPANTWTLQVDLHDDLMVTALEQVFPNFGGDPTASFADGLYLWDIADPVRPKRLGHFQTGGTGSHRNLYPGGRYVHVAAGMAGYRGNIYVILDIADPQHPREAGRWWVPGQHETEPPLAAPGRPSPCCATGHHVSLHGPPYITGDLAYLPYGEAGLIVLDISDVSAPRRIGHLPFSPPFHAQFGVHGVLPLPDRGIAFANSENVNYGAGPAHHASIVDITDPTTPHLRALFPEPVPPPGAPYPDFTTRGGWRGPHNMNHHQHHPDVQPQGDLFYLAHFNAGLRIYDVANTHLIREVGYFIPPEPTQRYGPLPQGDLVVQTEDVVVDRRGYIYITDKNQGLWITRYTG